ncbi:TPA: DUF1398 family protein [Enterobacter cloacae]|nr:DUF1398 family protein [Enterobacter cloacae]
MSETINHVMAVLQSAGQLPAREAHFPHFAKLLYQAGIRSNTWTLPACQAVYVTDTGSVILMGEPLINAPEEVPVFCAARLMAAIRDDQAGNTTFREFLKRIWQAGVVSYRVDLVSQTVTYYGLHGDEWEESYPDVAYNSFLA